MEYETGRYVCNFGQFQTMRSFGDNVFNGKITISEFDQKQSNLSNIICDFDNKARARSNADKEGKSKSEIIP